MYMEENRVKEKKYHEFLKALLLYKYQIEEEEKHLYQRASM